MKDEEGTTYYYDKETGETTWRHPGVHPDWKGVWFMLLPPGHRLCFGGCS